MASSGSSPFCWVAFDYQLIDEACKRALDKAGVFRVSSFLCDSPALKHCADGIGDDFRPILERARKDREALSGAKKRNKAKKILGRRSPYTGDVLRQAIDHIVANENMGMPDKEWLDLLHMVVPVAHCDFVLLDRRWLHFVRNCLPLQFPDIARVYSEGDVSTFLSDLSTFTVART